MKYFDMHTHTVNSPDGHFASADMARAAYEAGLEGICFTDHVDIGHPDDIYAVLPDYDKMREGIAEAKRLFPDLSIGYGIEAGYIAETAKATKEYIERGGFEFVILSTHVINGQEPYDKVFYNGKTKEQAYEEYLIAAAESLKAPFEWDIFGHIGYAQKPAPYEDTRFVYSLYADIIDTILSGVIAKGKGIEVNTSGARNGDMMPNPDILKRYRELGGEVITLGSDGHYTEYVGYKFGEAAEIAKSCGFRYAFGLSGGKLAPYKL